MSMCELLQRFCARHALSRREAEVLRLCVSGATAKETAIRLRCSQRTVDDYWARIFRKVSLRSKTEILASLLRTATAFADPEERPGENTGATARPVISKVPRSAVANQGAKGGEYET
jgi:DNA-binding CsgD family transcriptional regulator